MRCNIKMGKKRPHILIFNPDEYRGDVLSHLGNPGALTPNFDRLTETDGVSFSNAFCQNPVCTPSRCCFMSGWYPHVRGHRTMFHMMHEEDPVLLETLKKEGYFVWWGGKNDLTPGQKPIDNYCNTLYRAKPDPDLPSDPNWRGTPAGDNYYSFYKGKLNKGNRDVYYDSDWDNVYGAIDFMHNAPEDQPLCIYLPLGFPHPPYGVEEPWYSAIDRDKVPRRAPTPENWESKPSMLYEIYKLRNMDDWSEERWQELRATYYGMCARIDYQFGLLVEALKETGLYEDTAIFIFSDHGDFAGDYGMVEKSQNTFEDCLTKVPFIIKPPSWVEVESGIREALVELTDFSATVEDLTGIEPDHTHFGRSLLPLIVGETDEHRDAVFSEGGRLHGETHCMELESVEHQEPEGLYWPSCKVQRSEGPEHTKAIMCRTENYKYVRRLYESDELYDLSKDPQETDNRIDDNQLTEVLSKLKERLLTFYLRTSDVVPHATDKRGFLEK